MNLVREGGLGLKGFRRTEEDKKKSKVLLISIPRHTVSGYWRGDEF